MGARGPSVLIVDDNVEFADLVGTLIAEQGLMPVLAHTAQNAMTLAKLYSPAAIIVDLLLPDMTGHKLIKELWNPAGAPIFVITGVFKGQAQVDKVRAIAAISGWFEKPFDTRVLVEQVVKIVGKPVVDRVAHRRVGQVTPDFDIDILDPVESEGIRDRQPRSEPAQPVLAKDADDIDIEIDVDLASDGLEAEALWDVVEKATPARATGDLPPIVAPEADRTPEVPIAWPAGVPTMDLATTHDLGDATPTPAQVKSGLRAKMRSGELKAATVARLLTAFYVSRETGEIAFERGGVRKVVYLSEGRPVYARSNQDVDRIGAIARKAFGLSASQIDRALDVARKTDRMIGDVLIEQKLLEESRRPDLVREQTRAIIRSLFGWSDGRYVIGFNVRDHIQRAELEEHPAALVLAGIREQIDVEKLRKLVPDRMTPMPSPTPPYELHELPLDDAQAVLLVRATGARTVAQLIGEVSTRVDEREARSFVYALLLLGMLVAGRGARPRPTTTPAATGGRT